MKYNLQISTYLYLSVTQVHIDKPNVFYHFITGMVYTKCVQFAALGRHRVMLFDLLRMNYETKS